MSVEKRPLHLAKTLEDLNKNISVPLVSNMKVTAVINSLDKMYKKAEEELKQGEEENAYVLFMKYIELLKTIRRRKDYKEDQKYFDSLTMVSTRAKKAVQSCEELTDSLQKRYEDLKNKEDAKIEAKLAKKLNKDLELKNSSLTTLKQTETDGYLIMEAKQLFSLISQKSSTFLLLDVRPESDYSATKIKHPNSLNVPTSILTPGSTAKAIERALHVESKTLWNRRSSMDMLIMLDWFSQSVEANSALDILRQAMYKWDQNVCYSCKTPFLLRGGFEQFFLTYPMLVTDSKRARDLAQDLLKVQKGPDQASNWKNVEYPDFERSTMTKRLENISNDFNSSSAVTSGALTISKKPPSVPDRAIKPKLTENQPAGEQNSLANDNRNGWNDETKVSEKNGSNGFERTISAPPKVDRSLKARALLANKENRNEDLTEVLEAEKDLVEDSYKMEKEELELEHEWTIIRLRREKEAEEELKEELLKSEKALFDRLEKMEEDRIERDKENEDLRKQLEELKAKLEVNNNRNDERTRTQVSEEIRRREEQRRRLKAEVEQKRKERKMRQIQMAKDAEAKKSSPSRTSVNSKPREIITKVPLKKDGSSNSLGINSDLSRSHSSPNIAQMLEEDDRLAAQNIPAPKFDRHSKPTVSSFNRARARNFQPVWGTGKKGLTGLRNLGNTCYMNSILQCLSNFTLPAQYFIDQIFKRDLNNNSETRGEIAIEFAELIRALWSGQYKSISPTDFKRMIGKYMEAFRGNSQQDAHEFLTMLMEWLNDDLNEVKRKVQLPELDYDRMSEIEAAEKSWEVQKKVEKSFIQETFFGQTRSTCECQSCGYRSYKFEKFLGLTLVLPPGNGKCNLHQCIQDLLREEVVDYVCERCKSSKKAKKKLEIVRFPLILTIHLKRFYKDYDIDVWRKKQNMVDFELTDFNAGQYAKACGGKLNYYRNFQLYGVCNHFGSLEGGHYTAYCYSQVYGKWYKYDDQEVTTMSASNVKTAAAYILFYSAKN